MAQEGLSPMRTYRTAQQFVLKARIAHAHRSVQAGLRNPDVSQQDLDRRVARRELLLAAVAS